MKNFLKFAGIGVLSTTAVAGVMFVFSDVIGFPAFAVAIAYAPINLVWRYYANKKVVFGS